MLAKELPVYKDTFDLLSLLEDYVAIFPKCHRFTIGQKLINVSLELFEYISLANRAVADRAARARYLEGFMIKFGVVETLLRLCKEKRIITVKQTARLATT